MYSDEELTAYLDGEMDPGKMADIQNAIESGEIPAARLLGLNIDKSAINNAFASLLDAAPAQAVPAAAAPRHFARLGAVAAILLALATAFFGSKLAPQKSWEMEVAHYQALYVAETLTGIQPTPQRLAQEIARANQLLGLNLSIETLSGFKGLTLRRAQVLGFEGQTLIQIAYTTANGTPIAFCILKQQNSVDQAIATTELVGLAAATWQSTDHSFLTIGGQDQDLMSDFATHLAALL